jgi:hypothetical protein
VLLRTASLINRSLTGYTDSRNTQIKALRWSTVYWFTDDKTSWPIIEWVYYNDTNNPAVFHFGNPNEPEQSSCLMHSGLNVADKELKKQYWENSLIDWNVAENERNKIHAKADGQANRQDATISSRLHHPKFSKYYSQYPSILLPLQIDLPSSNISLISLVYRPESAPSSPLLNRRSKSMLHPKQTLPYRHYLILHFYCPIIQILHPQYSSVSFLFFFFFFICYDGLEKLTPEEQERVKEEGRRKRDEEKKCKQDEREQRKRKGISPISSFMGLL